MGGKPSTLQSEDSSEDGNNNTNCQRCFFFDTPFKSNDPMGSPIPDSPQQRRDLRKEYQKALGGGNRDDEMYSSRYSGLEKEVVSKNSNSISISNNKSSSSSSSSTKDQNGRHIAQVHEGKDAEKELHAKYQLMEVLGVGSTSTCHRCLNRQSDIHYACKIIDKQLIEERFQGMMDQFHTEIRALRELQHPNIIQLYDVYITTGKIFIIMELMEGGELFDYVVQKGTLTEEEASNIVRKVTGALVYMHSKNIVHRDLKPENLLLRTIPRHMNETVEVKIIDFGLSKCMEEEVARSFLGTRGYLAPEMLQRRDYTRAVDAWALGVIVFVLLCGCLPFDDDSQTVPSDDLVRAKFVLRFPRWAKNLSASAKDLLSHLLDVNPKTRFTAEMALDHPWVKGTTAPKESLLASPGRIKKSPNIRKTANGTPGSASRSRAGGASGRYQPPNRGPQKSPVASHGPGRVQHVRKSSI